eukprot:scaffold20945_cov33-Tisochrysis_lutea.AAC.1
MASALILGDTLTIRNVTGLLVCLVGIGFYTYVKHQEDGEAQPPPARSKRCSTYDAKTSHPNQEEMSELQQEHDLESPDSERQRRLGSPPIGNAGLTVDGVDGE